MFHKWLGYNLFYRDDIRKVRVGDLQLLYAAINKVPTSPITLLVSHWLSIPSVQGPVGCTSLITRLAFNLHLLEMHDGNDEQLLCLLTFKYLAFILEFF